MILQTNLKFLKNMLEEKEKYNDSIVKYLKENKDRPRMNIRVGFYRINITTDYKKLYEQYIKDRDNIIILNINK